jgi:2,3-bisphosphoglycerate-independent phosphoglycerate mutase
LLIDLLALSPVASTEDANDATSVREPHSEDSAATATEAEVAGFLGRAVSEVLGENSVNVQERAGGLKEADAMLLLVGTVLTSIPLERGI